MAILLSAQNLEKSFGAQTLFRGLSFGIETGDRVGLIGPNGAGKSTLLRIIANETEPDGGQLVKSRGLRVGYLEQTPRFKDGATIFDAVAEGAEDDFDRLAAVHEWIAKLKLTDDTRGEDTLVTALSGGWKKRVALARELTREPDLLVLDEPTNHLDLESILWLEDLLKNARFATLTVTHDRAFLQHVANRIFDLDKKNPDGLLVVRGTYADYVEAKDQLMASQLSQEESVRNNLRRETEWLRRGAKARTTKQNARIERAGELGELAEDLRERNQNRSARIDFQSAERHPQKLIEAVGISKKYGERTLFPSTDLLISPKTRMGLIGTNGSGKTTLIRILLGEETPTTGTVKRADRLQPAYFSQTSDELDPKLSVLRNVVSEGDYVDYRGTFIFARSYLDRFLFRGEQMDMPVAKLSGGEKSRLRIARLMLRPSNLLVLDEPTNDLDVATLTVLEQSLRDFDGAVILVTHDRYFLDQVSNQIFAFTSDASGNGHLERFADSLQWEEWVRSRPKQEAAAAKAAAASAAPAKKRKLSYNEQRELSSMEDNLLKLETRQSELQTEAGKPENAANAIELARLMKELASIGEQIEKLYARWAELEA